MYNKKVLITAVKELDKAKAPAKQKDIITDPMGQWKYPGQVTRIPSNTITMQGVDYPVYGVPDKGEPMMMMPGAHYNFPGADYVDEYPQMKRGGGLGSKKYTRNIEGTNYLFATSDMFKKPKKLSKKRIYHPNAKYYEEGGALLTKEVTCKNCGWEWDAADGGDDITTCHKCGGQGLVHAQDGGQLTCPPFHKYDSELNQCVAMTEEEKAASGKKFMQDWVESPRAKEMLQESIQKDNPNQDVTQLTNNVNTLRRKLTEGNANIHSAENAPSVGYAEPRSLDDMMDKNNKVLSTTMYDPNLLSYRTTDFEGNPVDFASTVNFFTKGLPGNHAYVYPHEYSHNQDMAGDLIPKSDKELIDKYKDKTNVPQDELNAKYNKDGEWTPEFETELVKEFRKDYPNRASYQTDKELYEKNFSKFLKDNHLEGDYNNNVSYEDFVANQLPDNFFNNEGGKPGLYGTLDQELRYLSNPTETRARLNAIRMYGKENNVYDPFTEKVTPEVYQKLLDVHNQENLNERDANQLRQLKSVYTDEEILDMLNTISYNKDSDLKNDLSYAEYGGQSDYIEVELTPEQIKEYAKGGFIIEDISVPSLNQRQTGGSSNCPEGYVYDERVRDCVPASNLPSGVESVTSWPDAPEGWSKAVLNMEEVPVTAQAPQWLKISNEYEKKNSKQAFIESKKRDYLKKTNKGLSKMAGLSMDNFPKDVETNFANEYDYKKNSYVTKKLGKQKGFNPRKRDEWVEELSPGERKVVANSRYGSKLQPGYWNRALAGVQELGNTLLPGQPLQYDIPGLTKKEQKEMRDSKISALEVFAPMDIPGAVAANYLKNTGLSTGANYAEQPAWYSGEKMANVDDTDAMALNPLNYIGLEAIPELGVNLAKGAKALPGAIKASTETGLLSNAYKVNPWARKINPSKFYRQIGEAGLQDALSSNVIRSADQTRFPRPHFVAGENFNALESTGTGAHGRPSVVFETSGLNREGDPVMFPANASSEYTPWMADAAEIPLSEGQLLRRDWLRGYTEIDTPVSLPGSPNELKIVRPPSVPKKPLPSQELIANTYQELLNNSGNNVLEARARLADKYGRESLELVDNPTGNIPETLMMDPSSRNDFASFMTAKRNSLQESLRNRQAEAMQIPAYERRQITNFGEQNIDTSSPIRHDLDLSDLFDEDLPTIPIVSNRSNATWSGIIRPSNQRYATSDEIRRNFNNAGKKTKGLSLKSVKDVLSTIDEGIGKIIDKSKMESLKQPIRPADIEADVNKLLDTGLGIKKGDVKIKVVTQPGGEVQVLLNTYEYFKKNKKLIEDTYGEGSYDNWMQGMDKDTWIDSGKLNLSTTLGEEISPRKFTEILRGKPLEQSTRFGIGRDLTVPAPGLKRSGDFPFANWNTDFRENVLDNLGISGELTQAYKKAAQNKGYEIYSGGTGHMQPGAKRYVRELLNDRVEIMNPNDAENLFRLLNDEAIMGEVNKALKNKNVPLPSSVQSAIQPLIFKYKRKGGATNDTVEKELSLEEIKDYIDNGYIIEEID